MWQAELAASPPLLQAFSLQDHCQCLWLGLRLLSNTGSPQPLPLSPISLPLLHVLTLPSASFSFPSPSLSFLLDGTSPSPPSQLDQRLTGYIKKVMSYGCFVEFPHNLSALAPTKFLRDEFVSDPGQAFQEGQTVFAKVSGALSSFSS